MGYHKFHKSVLFSWQISYHTAGDFFFNSMAHNVHRAFQDIDLGIDDTHFVLPTKIVRQAEEENIFILIGRPVMPRHQNLHGIISTRPRNWGLEGLARGRIIGNR